MGQVKHLKNLGIDYKLTKEQMTLITNSQHETSDLKVKTDLLEEFWINRWTESRRYVLTFNIFMFLGTISNLGSPNSPDEVMMSWLYVGWCMVIFALLLLSYKQGPWLALI